MLRIRYLGKLVDELADGNSMERFSAAKAPGRLRLRHGNALRTYRDVRYVIAEAGLAIALMAP